MDYGTDELDHILNELEAATELDHWVAAQDQELDQHDGSLLSLAHHRQGNLESNCCPDSHYHDRTHIEDGNSQSDGDDEQPDSSHQDYLQDLAAFAAQEPASPLARTGLTDWQKRCQSQHNSFVALRPTLLQSDLLRHAVPLSGSRCGSCSNLVAQIVCLECEFPTGRLLCGPCDEAAHPYAHLHRRQSIPSGCLLPLQPSHGFDAAGREQQKGLCFNIRPAACAQCGSKDLCDPEPTAESLTYVMNGRIQFFKGHCKCSSCGHYERQALTDFVKVGFWPGTTDAARFETVYDQRVFRRFASLADGALNLSIKSWLRAFAEEAREFGGKGEEVPSTGFTASYMEWRYMEEDKLKSIQLIDVLTCAACHPAPHSLHIDANMKTFVYDRHREPYLEPYHEDVLFSPGALVVQHIKDIDAAMGKQEYDRTCKGLWAAAGDRKSRCEKMSISGTCFAVCRHQVPCAAANLYKSGERYGYSHFLQTEKLLARNPPAFIHQDIACKHKPWRQRVDAAFERCTPELAQTAAYRRISATSAAAASVVDVLPEAHGLLHSWTCQVLFSALWKDGAGAGSGEDAELFFSFLSTAAGTTRHMGEARRDDRLTHGSLAWAGRKRVAQPKLLADRMAKILAKLSAASAALEQESWAVLAVSSADGTATILSLVAQVKELAAGELQKSRFSVSTAMEYFTISQRIADGEKLVPFVGGVQDQAARAVAAKDGDLAQLHRLAASLISELQALKSRQQALEPLVVSSLSGVTGARGQQLQDATFKEVAEEFIIQQQNKTEALVVQRQKHYNKLQHFARTSKEKTKYQGKLRADEKQLKDAVDMYNSVIPFGTTLRPVPLTLEELTAQPPVFPWAAEASGGVGEQSLLRRYGTYASIRLCETYLKVQRLQEEVVLLRKEARQYIQYCESNAASIAGLLSRLEAGDEPAEIFLPAEEGGRYFSWDALTAPSATAAERLCSGVASLLLGAQAEVRELLEHANKVLGPLLGSSPLDVAAQVGDGGVEEEMGEELEEPMDHDGSEDVDEDVDLGSGNMLEF